MVPTTSQAALQLIYVSDVEAPQWISEIEDAPSVTAGIATNSADVTLMAPETAINDNVAVTAWSVKVDTVHEDYVAYDTLGTLTLTADDYQIMASSRWCRQYLWVLNHLQLLKVMRFSGI